ncbi:MAG: PPC domain-containing DNA-binding protein [Mycobacterium sp.]
MEWVRKANDVFIRIDPGEELITSVVSVADTLSIETATITSGVGMIDGLIIGFFDVDRDDYNSTRLEGVFDLSSVTGNIVRGSGGIAPHVHAVFNDIQHATFSGHVLEAKCHITIEIFLSTNDLLLERRKVFGCPATRIVEIVQPHDLLK